MNHPPDGVPQRRDPDSFAGFQGLSFDFAECMERTAGLDDRDLRLERPAPSQVLIGGVQVSKGSRVRLHPRPGGDILDLALAGRVAYVEAIEQDFEDRIHLAVTVEDDPGRDLGDERQPGHRFFFSPEEVEPLDGEAGSQR